MLRYERTKRVAEQSREPRRSELDAFGTNLEMRSNLEMKSATEKVAINLAMLQETVAKMNSNQNLPRNPLFTTHSSHHSLHRTSLLGDARDSDQSRSGVNRDKSGRTRIKVELPLFNGDGDEDDVGSWIVRMEEYFRIKATAEKLKAEVASEAMEDDALYWFEEWEFQRREKSWEVLKEDINRRFQPRSRKSENQKPRSSRNSPSSQSRTSSRSQPASFIVSPSQMQTTPLSSYTTLQKEVSNSQMRNSFLSPPASASSSQGSSQAISPNSSASLQAVSLSSQDSQQVSSHISASHSPQVESVSVPQQSVSQLELNSEDKLINGDEKRVEEKSSVMNQLSSAVEYESAEDKIAGSELENQVVSSLAENEGHGEWVGSGMLAVDPLLAVHEVSEGTAIAWQSNSRTTTAFRSTLKEGMCVNKEETEDREEGNDGKKLQGIINAHTDATKDCDLDPSSESNSSYQVAPKRKLVGHLTILKKFLYIPGALGTHVTTLRKKVNIAHIGILDSGSGLTREPALMLQAEERAHGQEQKNAVNFYILCAKDASGEVHWQNLYKGLHRVSLAVKGRYGSFQKIEDAPRATKAGNSFLETLGIIQGSRSEDDGNGYEYINGAKLSSSVATLIMANTEGLWKMSNRCLLVKLLVGKGDTLESFVTNGEPLQTAMPSENEESRLVIASEVLEGLHKFDGFRIDDKIPVKYVRKGVGVRTTGTWKEKVGYITGGFLDIFLVLDNEFNSAILQTALIIGENVRRKLIGCILVQREGAGNVEANASSLSQLALLEGTIAEAAMGLSEVLMKAASNRVICVLVGGRVFVDKIITDLKTSDKTVLSTDIDSASMIPSLLRRDCERGSKQILILMNSGATLNLISQKLIEVVQMYYKAAVMFQAKMGKGEHISLQSSCEVLQTWVHHLVMTEDSYLLDLGEFNVILGMGPLANHGNAQKIFSKHSIKWLGEGQYATKSLSLFFLAMLFRAMKGVTMKVGIRKVWVQKSVRYWEGRGARMKCKWKIMADSYHPP